MKLAFNETAFRITSMVANIVVVIPVTTMSRFPDFNVSTVFAKGAQRHRFMPTIWVFVIVFFTSFTQSLQAQNWDINTVKAINPENPDSKFFRGVSSSVYVIGIGAPVGILTAGLISGDSILKRKSYVMFAAALIELAVTGGIKNIVNRQRPVEKYPLDVFPYASYSGKSIPSGHTSMAFATATSLSLQFRNWYIVIPSYIWATTVGYSRIYLGVHYPSDVIAGAVLGAGSAYLAHWLNRKIIQNRNRFKHR